MTKKVITSRDVIFFGINGVKHIKKRGKEKEKKKSTYFLIITENKEAESEEESEASTK